MLESTKFAGFTAIVALVSIALMSHAQTCKTTDACQRDFFGMQFKHKYCRHGDDRRISLPSIGDPMLGNHGRGFGTYYPGVGGAFMLKNLGFKV